MDNCLLPPMEFRDELGALVNPDAIQAQGGPGEPTEERNVEELTVQRLLAAGPVDIGRLLTLKVTRHDEGQANGDSEESGAQGSSRSRKRTLSFDDDNVDGTECPICYSSWSNTGEHRICSLKCGHLFGYKCIRQWSAKQKTCPICKSKVNTSDVRFLYANKVIAVDATEIETVQMELNMVVEEKNKMALALAQSFTKHHALCQGISMLKRKLFDVTNQTPLPVSEVHPDRLYMDKSLEVCKHSGCRVFGINCALDLLVVSMRSPNNLFSGYGLKTMQMSVYKPLSFIPLHSQPIRDVCFHPENMWTLTVGMDKTAKVVDLTTNTVRGSAICQTPLWSCCWDVDNSNYFYCGAQSGTVFKYDMRNLQAPVTSLSVPGDMSPVVSVAKIPNRPGSGSMGPGIISCKLNSMWFFENNEDNTRHNIPLEGPFVSMKYQQETEQLLVSARPNNHFQYSRHTVCTLQKDEAEITCNIAHCFPGGGMQKLLSRSTFIKNRNNNYVAAYHESDKRVHLWSLSTGRKVVSVPAFEAVLDIGCISNQLGNYLVFLTEKRAEFFKFH